MGGTSRLHRPLMRDGNGVQQPVSWHELTSTVCDRLAAAGTSNPDGVRFLLSAHAAHEELFLFRRLAEELIGESTSGPTRSLNVSWRHQPKVQPPNTKFKVSAID